MVPNRLDYKGPFNNVSLCSITRLATKIMGSGAERNGVQSPICVRLAGYDVGVELTQLRHGNWSENRKLWRGVRWRLVSDQATSRLRRNAGGSNGRAALFFRLDLFDGFKTLDFGGL